MILGNLISVFRRFMPILFVAMIVSVLSTGVCAKTRAPSSSDFSKPILVKSSMPVFTVSFPSNRTTGYQWLLQTYNRAMITPMSAQYQAPDGSVVGAPGVSRWTFKLGDAAFSVPHVFHITMLYARPWDLKDGKKKTITVVTQ